MYHNSGHQLTATHIITKCMYLVTTIIHIMQYGGILIVLQLTLQLHVICDITYDIIATS